MSTPFRSNRTSGSPPSCRCRPLLAMGQLVGMAAPASASGPACHSGWCAAACEEHQGQGVAQVVLG